MILIPFGEVKEDRVKISKDYKLIEQVGGIWRLTFKCKSNYQPESYVMYLRGAVEKPVKITGSEKFDRGYVGPRGHTGPTGEKKLTPQQEMRTKEYQDAVNELFKL